MSKLKTKVNDADVREYINSVDDAKKRADSLILHDLLTRITSEQPKMWGESIIGFGQYHYKSERSSQEGDWPLIGFSPRKQNLSIYIMDGFKEYPELLHKLGKHKTSVSCLYINKLDDVDMTVLEEIVRQSYATMKAQHTP